MFGPDIADKVAKLCYEQFDKLPKKGKPVLNKEWTLLAGVIMTTENEKLDVIALTTGTKCLGFSQLKETGFLISDSHAEILARRGLLRFLYHHMHLAVSKKNSHVLFFNPTHKKFALKDGVKFHLFISHVPCGDAAIFPKSPLEDKCQPVVENESGERPPKRQKTESSDSKEPKLDDIYRTGAKCVENETQDPKCEGPGFHVTGVLRTKPGRGDPTWSMSCSDKLALWNVCGMQGALMSYLLMKPVYLASLVIGKCPFNSNAAQRAISGRLASVSALPEGYILNKPCVVQSSLEFKFSKENVTKTNLDAVPCPSSIIWCAAPNSLEVSVNGARQGVTKKNRDEPTSRLSICKSALFEQFLQIQEHVSENSAEIQSRENATYFDNKRLAVPYQEAKTAVWKVFTNWKRKPEHLQKFGIPKTRQK